MIDVETESYTYSAFKHDLWKYFINPNGSYTAQVLNYHLDRMNMEQYNLELNYTNNKSPVLEYSDYHARIMMKVSVMQNMIIPLLTHFIEKKKMNQQNIKDILLETFDLLFEAVIKVYNVDLDVNKQMIGKREGLKTCILDIRAKFNDGEECNIELQVSPYKHMPDRMLQYWSMNYINKLERGEDYSKIKPTIAVLITCYKLDEIKEEEF